VATAWINVGRVWTNGDCFLALDATLLPHWRGLSDDTYQSVVVGLDQEVTSVRVGSEAAALVATDPEVGDEGWIEVFQSDGAIALIQAAPDDDAAYGQLVTTALKYPSDEDERGDPVKLRSGELVLLSAALDGTGPDSPPLQPAIQGEVPAVWPDIDEVGEAAGLLLHVNPATFGVRVRWFTELPGGSFARWMLIADRLA
jgi:hypothetical protein